MDDLMNKLYDVSQQLKDQDYIELCNICARMKLPTPIEIYHFPFQLQHATWPKPKYSLSGYGICTTLKPHMTKDRIIETINDLGFLYYGDGDDDDGNDDERICVIEINGLRVPFQNTPKPQQFFIGQCTVLYHETMVSGFVFSPVVKEQLDTLWHSLMDETDRPVMGHELGWHHVVYN
jgi:hypothetical protein